LNRPSCPSGAEPLPKRLLKAEFFEPEILFIVNPAFHAKYPPTTSKRISITPIILNRFF
jgi:hypothetical protein